MASLLTQLAIVVSFATKKLGLFSKGGYEDYHSLNMLCDIYLMFEDNKRSRSLQSESKVDEEWHHVCVRLYQNLSRLKALTPHEAKIIALTADGSPYPTVSHARLLVAAESLR